MYSFYTAIAQHLTICARNNLIRSSLLNKLNYFTRRCIPRQIKEALCWSYGKPFPASVMKATLLVNRCRKDSYFMPSVSVISSVGKITYYCVDRSFG